MLAAVLIAARVLTGLLAGGFFLATLGLRPAAESLSPPDHIRLRQALIPRFRRLFLPLMLLAAAATALWLFSRPAPPPTRLWLALSCAVLVPATTLLVNVPVNNRVLWWSPESPPTGWGADLARWNAADALRLALSLTAFLCVVIS